MNKTQKLNLIQTALCMLTDKSREFVMQSFANKEGGEVVSPNRAMKCGTSACFAGYGVVAGIKPKPREEWGPYMDRCFGTSLGDNLSAFLFDASWPNDRVCAAQRALVVLELGKSVLQDSFHPYENSMDKKYNPYVRLTERQVINRLKKLQAQLQS